MNGRPTRRQGQVAGRNPALWVYQQTGASGPACRLHINVRGGHASGMGRQRAIRALVASGPSGSRR